MWAPSGVNFVQEERNKSVRIKDLGDGRNKVRFITQKRKEEIKKSGFFDCGYMKSESKSPEGLDRDDSASVFSTKAGTVIKDSLRTPNKSIYTYQSQSSLIGDRKNIVDDWEILDDHYGTIRAIGIYTTYYVKGIQIYFETDDLKTVNRLHACKGFDPEGDPKLNYKEILLEDGEFIDKINCVKSTQTNYIRSITFFTNFERILWVEGEIEVHDLLQPELEIRTKIGNNEGDITYAEYHNTFVGDQSYEIDKSSLLNKKLKYKSILLEGHDEELYDLDKLELRKQSIVDHEIKNHTINLRYMNQIVVGFKTLFCNEYLEDLELYTEQFEDIKIRPIET